MSQLFTNNFSTKLASGISDSATSVSITTGDGVKLGTISSPNFYIGTLVSATNKSSFEIVKITARTNDTLTIERAQESTTAKSFSTNDILEIRITAKFLTDIQSSSSGTIDGDLTISGTARRIRGDFSNATVTNRTIFQTSTANSSTGIFFTPNGTGTGSYLMPTNNSNPTNCGMLLLGCNAGMSQIVSGKQGTGTAVPMVFQIDTTEVMRIGTDFKVGIGTGSPLSLLHIQNTNTDPIRGFISEQISNDGGAAQVRMMKARGTTSAKAVPQLDDYIGNLSYTGYASASVNSECAAIRAAVSETWTATSSPASILFFTCPRSSLTGVERMRILDNGRILINKTADDGLFQLQVQGAVCISPSDNATNGAAMELGRGRTGSGYAFIDFVGDTTYTDYGLRVIRNNTGSNTESQIIHRGTGTLDFITSEAASITFRTSYTEQMRLSSAGRLLIGTATDDATHLLQVNGNIGLIGTARRIRGDFNNATHASRVLFQSTATGQTNIGVIPNGTGQNAAFTCYESPTASNCSYAQLVMATGSSDVRLISGIIGSGTPRPLLFIVGTSEVMRMTTAGRVLIGTSTDDATNLLQVNGNIGLIGTARRIRGDFSNSTQANQVAFQTSTTNSGTFVLAIPNGTSTGASFYSVDSSSVANCGYSAIGINVNYCYVQSSKLGTGTVKPMAFLMDGTNEAMRITTTRRLLIGTTTDNGYAKLTVCNGSNPAVPFADTAVHITGASDQVVRLVIDSYSDSQPPVVTGRRSRGTVSSPTAVQADDSLFGISGTGYANAWVNSSKASVNFRSSQTWTATANGTYITFVNTPNDSTTAVERMRILDNGRILIGTTTDDGNNTVQVVGDGGVSGSIAAKTYGVVGNSPNSALGVFGSRGTVASPTAIQSGDRIGLFVATAQYSTSAARNTAAIQFYATENHDATHGGTYMSLETCANGETTRSARIMISATGRVLIGTTTDDATNLLQVNGSIVQKPLTSVTPANNGEMVFELTNNTTLKVKVKGSDGTVRSGTITLA